MTSRLTFDPQSISSKHVCFANSQGDAIQFSYSGSFKQRGVDYEEIPLATLFQSKVRWNCRQMMNPAWKIQGNTPNKEECQQELALRLKHLYVDRNIYAINRIIHQKNRDCIESKKKWANTSLLVKITRYVLKVLSCGSFDFRDHLHQRYEKVHQYEFLKTTHSPSLSGNKFMSYAVEYFVNSLTEPTHARFFEALKIKGKTVNLEDKANQIRQALNEFIKSPNKKVEDYLELSEQVPGCDFAALYQLDLTDVVGHESYMNGHLKAYSHP